MTTDRELDLTDARLLDMRRRINPGSITIEPSGREGESIIYIGRDHQHHGYNVAYVSNPAPQWADVADLLTMAPDLLAEVLKLRAAYSACCERLGTRDKADPDARLLAADLASTRAILAEYKARAEQAERAAAEMRDLCRLAANWLDDLNTGSGDAMAARLRAAGRAS